MNQHGPVVTVEQALEIDVWLQHRERALRGTIKTLENNNRQITVSRDMWRARCYRYETEAMLKKIEDAEADYKWWVRCQESQIKSDRRRERDAQERGAERRWWVAALLFTVAAGILLVVALATGHI